MARSVKPWLVGFVLALGLCATGNTGAAPSRYFLTDLGGMKFPGTNLTLKPFALNDYGQVTGSTDFNQGLTRGFLWQPHAPNAPTGRIIDIGDVPGATNSNYGAGPINNRGQIIIDSVTLFSPFRYEVYLWDPATPNAAAGTITKLAGNSGDHFFASRQMNEYGQVLMEYDFQDAYIWQPASPHASSGTLVKLEGSPRMTSITGINNHGQVLGSFRGSGESFFPVLWHPASPNATTGGMVALTGPPGSHSADGSAITEDGRIFGYHYTQAGHGSPRYFMWTPSVPNGTTGVYTDLGTLALVDMNSQGVMIGSNGSQGIIRTPEGTFALTSLLDSSLQGWTVGGAMRINEHGQILAEASFAGQVRTVLLTPVPEPAFVTTVSLAVGYFLRRRCRSAW